jgi:hypothetical protein
VRFKRLLLFFPLAFRCAAAKKPAAAVKRKRLGERDKPLRTPNPRGKTKTWPPYVDTGGLDGTDRGGMEDVVANQARAHTLLLTPSYT